MDPEQSFFRLALLREQERQAVLKFNALLRQGRFAEAEQYLRDQAQNVGAFKVLLAGQPAVSAFLAVAAYRAAPAAPDARTMKQRLASVDAECGILGGSPEYRAWRTQEEDRLRRLEAEERRRRLRQLEEEFDVGVLRGDPQIETLITRIRNLDQTHLLVALDTAAAAGTRSAFMTRDFATSTELAAVERTACRRWFELPQRVKSHLLTVIGQRPAATLPGTLLRALLAAADGHIPASVRHLRMLPGTTAPAPRYLQALLSPNLLPRDQFDAHCWRSPCPSVADYLNRLAQVRTRLATPAAAGQTSAEKE
jgi:hypothetical protein